MDDLTRPLAARPPTLAHAFEARSRASADAVAFRYQVNGAWQESTWGQTRELVEPLAAGLLGLGVEPEERVVIMSENRFEWILAHLAASCAGTAVAAVQPSASAADVALMIDDSDAVVVFVDSLEQVAKLRAIRARIRRVRKVVLFDGQHPDARVMTLEELLVSGEEVLEADPGAIGKRLEAVRPEKLATISHPAPSVGAATDDMKAGAGAEGAMDCDDLQLISLPSDASAAVLLAAQMERGCVMVIE